MTAPKRSLIPIWSANYGRKWDGELTIEVGEEGVHDKRDSVIQIMQSPRSNWEKPVTINTMPYRAYNIEPS